MQKRGQLVGADQGQVELASSIQAAFRWYRETVDQERQMRDVYDTIAEASAALGLSKSLISVARKNGCPAFIHGRVHTAKLLRWLFSKEGDVSVDWPSEITKWKAKREKLRHDLEAGALVNREEAVAVLDRVLPAIRDIGEAKLLNEWPSAVAGMDPAQARIYGKRLFDQILDSVQSLKGEWQGL